MQLHRKTTFALLVSIALFVSACGGSSGGSGGGSTPSPTPTPTPSNVNEWTWMSGNSTIAAGTDGQPGVYGTLGASSTSNIPGSRAYAVGWTDSNGNLWLFGGQGYDSTGTMGDLNDLWEFNTTSKEWIWIGGSNTVNQPGVYGTQGVASPSDAPEARDSAVGWTDSSGNFWLYGGYSNSGYRDNLWEFDPSTKEWIWVSGSNTAGGCPDSVYGSLGVASASNTPGARESAVSWTNSNGDLWLYGGYCQPNDLWQYTPSTKEWTWMNGSNSITSATGVYGTQGVASASNTPGSRYSAMSWTDSSGNFWLFSGFYQPNDLWEYSPANKEWTWVSGSNSGADEPGVYGTQGVASANNVPGERWAAVSWTDSTGNLWLYGGEGCEDSTGACASALGDLWEFNTTTKEWTWMGGSSTVNQPGVFGTQGVASANNVPGARYGAVSWTDSSGNFWLFSGEGQPNDLWRYQP